MPAVFTDRHEKQRQNDAFSQVCASFSGFEMAKSATPKIGNDPSVTVLDCVSPKSNPGSANPDRPMVDPRSCPHTGLAA